MSKSAFKSEGHRFYTQLSREIVIILFCRCSVHGTTEQNREGTSMVFSLKNREKKSGLPYLRRCRHQANIGNFELLLLLLLLLRGFFAIRVDLPTSVGSYTYAPSLYGCHLLKKSVIKWRVQVAPFRGVVEKKGWICPKPKQRIFKQHHRPFHCLFCRRP